MVVEDERNLRQFIREALTGAGYTVQEALNGEDAIQAVTRAVRPPDLIITDIIMPKLDGRQMVDRITEMHRGIKVIFMSGYHDDRIGENMTLSPNISFLQKPFNVSDLLAKIRDALK